MAVDAPPPPVVVERGGAHRSGTLLDNQPYEPQVRPLGAIVGLIMFVVFAVVYGAIGYHVVIDQHVVVFDALDRLTRAFLIWHNAPPKLAAIGFLFPPLTTLVFLPFAAIKPVATTLIALPFTTAVFAAGAMVMLDRTLARCEMTFVLRLPLLVAFGINPLWVFYAGNGMSEAIYLAFLAFSLYCFVSWYETTEPRYLIGAGFGISLLIMTRYAFLIWAGLVALLIGVALVRRRASRIEVEGSVVAFAAPVIYAVALWILFNALIVGDPFGWVRDTTSAQAVNATGITTAGHLGFDDISRRLLELNVAVFPLAFIVVPALVMTFLSQRNDMALWLASFIVLGIVIIGVHAYTSQNEGLLTLRDSMPMMLTSLVGAAWVFRSFVTLRVVAWAATLALLVVNLFTAWQGMQDYPFQSLEQAFVRAVKTGSDQEGQPSRGGFRVGIRPEAQMAQYIKDHVTGRNAILTDNAQTFAVILLTGRADQFFDRIDRGDAKWRAVLEQPFGKVRWFVFAFNPRSGDLIERRYPQMNSNGVPGFHVAFRTDRYILVSVAARNPVAPAAATRSGARRGTRTPTFAPATG